MALWLNDPSTLGLADGTTATSGNTAAPDAFTPAVSAGTAVFRAGGAVGALPAHWQFQGDIARGDRTINSGTSVLVMWSTMDEASYASGDTSLLRHFSSTGSVSAVLRSDRTIDITNFAGTVLASTPAIPLTADYRLALAVGKGTTTANGTVRAELYYGANSQGTVPDWTYSATTVNAGTVNFTSQRFGKQTAGPTYGVRVFGVRAIDTQSDFSGGLSDPFVSSVASGVTFVGAGSPGAASGPSGVATAGLPAGVQHGDVLLMVVGTSRGTVSGSAAFSSSNLWNTIQTRGVNNGSVNAALNWGTRIYVPGDPSTYTATLGPAEATNTAIECFILAFRGVDPASLQWMGGVSSGSATTDGVASTTVTPPSAPIVDNHDGAMAVAIVSAVGNGGPYTTPAGWSVGLKAETSLGPVGNSLEAYYKAYAPGATATAAVAVTGTTSTKGGHQIVLNAARPAQTGTGARVRGSSNHAAHWSAPTMPVDKPEGTVTGDLMIAAASLDNAGNPVDLTPPGPEWTQFANGSVTGASGAGYWKAWWKYAAAGEADSYAWNKGTDGFGVVGIVSFFGAGVPTRWIYTAVGTLTASPSLDAVTGEAGAQLLGVLLAGTGTDTYRSLSTPTGMTEWVDERPPTAGGWNVLGMWTEALTSAASTGARVTNLLTQSSNLVAPATGATATYSGALIVVPAGGQGALAQTGSGSLALGPSQVDAAGTLARTGSGTVALGGGSTVAGALARDGSGALTLGGTPRPASTLARDGAGQATFGVSAMSARATLAQTGLGSLTVAGGGGAGALPRDGSGSVSFGVTPRLLQTLARTGSGSTSFASTKVTAGGLLARDGSGTLGLVGKPAMFGAIARTGSGQLNLVKAGMTTRLQAWNAALASWKPVLVQAWDAISGTWKLAAGRRASVELDMPGAAGPIYSDGAGPAGIYTLTALPAYPHRSGPTGLQIARMTRGPGGIGTGAYLAANLPVGTIPAGTWVEMTWWQRSDAAGADAVWQVIDDAGGQPVTNGFAVPTTPDWVKRTFKVKTLLPWTPNVHRLRAGIENVPGRWLDISDVRIRTWT